MGIFSSYIKTLFAVCVCASVCQAILSGSSKNSKTLENGLKLVISLCVIITILIPGSKLIKNLKTADMPSADSTKVSDNYLLSLTKKELEDELNRKIKLSTGILPLYSCINFDIEETQNGTEVSFASAEITLSKADSEMCDTVNKFASELLGCKVTTTTDGEK